MNPTSRDGRPFTIVVGVDYSELGQQALEYAISLGRSHERCRIHAVHVTGAAAVGPYAGTVVEPDMAEESKRLREYAERVFAEFSERSPNGGKPPFERLTTHVRRYRAAESIAQLATDVEADLVVIGTHGRRGLERFLLGSVAEATLRLAPCPVLVVRPLGATSGITSVEIEPPCPECLETRLATDGKEFWCARHGEKHDRPHTYHFNVDRSSHQSGMLLPF